MPYPPAVLPGGGSLTVRSFVLVVVLALAALVPSVPAAAGGVVVVDADGAADVAGCDASTAAPRTVSEALTTVVDGDVILVCPGTVVEPGQVVIHDDVTVRGADPARPPTITPGRDTGGNGDDRGWWLVEPGVTFELRDVRLDGAGRRLHQGIRFRGQGVVRDVAFSDIAYNAAGPDRSGFAVVAFGDGPVSVIGSSFRRIGRVGALYYGADTAGSLFASNIYVGKGDGAHLDYGVEVGAGAAVTVRDSVIRAARGRVDGTVSAGVLASTAFGGGTGVRVLGSTLRDNANGVFVEDTAGRGLGEVVVSRNRIERSSALGLAQAGGGRLTATCNWWGASDGPRTHGGSGDGASASVQPVPFLTSTDVGGRCAPDPVVRADVDDVRVAEGSAVEITGTFEAGSAAPLHLRASTGTIVERTPGNRGTWTWRAAVDDGPRASVTVTVTADNGHEGTATVPVTVRNVAPSADFVAPGTAFTDRAFTLSLRNITEPSSGDRAAGLRIAFDCGTGSGYEAVGTDTHTSCRIDRGGRRTVRARIGDRDGGVNEYTAVVDVYSPDGDGAPDRSAAGTVPAGGSVTTGDGEATRSDPIVTRVVVPSGGDVAIEEGPPAGTAPVDHELLTWGATVVAPAQEPSSPLELTFRLDADLLPAPASGTGVPLVAPVVDGAVVLRCAAGTAEAGGPCLASARWNGDDVLLRVRSRVAGAFDFAVPTRGCPTTGVSPSGFDDIAGTAHEVAVECAAWWGMVRGVSATSYRPAGAVTRGQVAATVARLLAVAGTELPGSPADRFRDDDGSVHELAIGQLAELGVMEGRTATSFAPDATMTRAQFASTLARAYAVLLGRELPEGPDRFRDDDGSPHEANIDAVAAASLAQGVAADRFDPHGAVRRDQTASFLTRLVDVWYLDRRA